MYVVGDKYYFWTNGEDTPSKDVEIMWISDDKERILVKHPDKMLETVVFATALDNNYIKREEPVFDPKDIAALEPTVERLSNIVNKMKLNKLSKRDASLFLASLAGTLTYRAERIYCDHIK